MRYRSSPLLLLAVLVSGIGGCTSTQRADSASRRVVTVLHDPGWQKGPGAVALIRELSRDYQLGLTVEKRVIRTQAEAEQCRFPGSPTVQVRGLDVQPSVREKRNYGFTWRFYPGASGMPSREMLMAALKEAGWMTHWCEFPVWSFFSFHARCRPLRRLSTIPQTGDYNP